MTYKPLILFLVITNIAIAQDSTKNIALNTEITIATRNIWRGLDYGSSPSMQGTLALTKDFFEVGAWGTTTLNGSKEGFGTWLELYATAKYKDFSLTIDDYFFFNSADSLNNYFEWQRDRTQHFIEARLKYDTDKLDLMAGYAFYKNKGDKTNGIYLEAEYYPVRNLSFIVGGVTSANWLSFYDAGGITTIGVSGRRMVNVSEQFALALKASLIFNPSYDKSVEAPGVGTNPAYFAVYLTL
jgi:hypothetical protein